MHLPASNAQAKGRARDSPRAAATREPVLSKAEVIPNEKAVHEAWTLSTDASGFLAHGSE